MQAYRFSDIAEILNADSQQPGGNAEIEYLLTDSRKLKFPERTLFFSINNSRKNADQFIPALYTSGVRSFITDLQIVPGILELCPEAGFIFVKDVLNALQCIAGDIRRKFSCPVIGITGSNGKTIVKEWLYQLLSNKYNIVRSPKSYNSQIGVPLSVWNMQASHTLGIFEAGISLPGEMEFLKKIIEPVIGIFTYAGDAHSEGFSSIEHKINEKLQLFRSSEVLIYCTDDPVLHTSVLKFKQNQNNTIRLFTWSRKGGAELNVTKIVKLNDGTSVYCHFQKTVFDFFIPFTDDASVHNAITCCCVLLYMGIPVASIAAEICQLRQVEMRLELKKGINNCSIINDSYSADLDSLTIALDFLYQQHHQKRTLILSDLLQTGYPPKELYGRLADMITRRKLNRFIGIGKQITSYKSAFENIPEKYFFASTTEFLEQLPSFHFSDETILLKGARVFQFEKISHILEQKLHETVLEINLNALRGNLKKYRQILHKDVKLMAMVKAFSYGSGTYEIASLLQHDHIDYLAVAYTDEAVELRKAGIRLPIMVMNTDFSGFNNILQYQLEPEMYSFNILKRFILFLEQNQIHEYRVHLKLDTGMHRLGFMESDMDSLCSFIKENKRIKIVSVFSHLVASGDEQHDTFTRKQADAFNRMTELLSKSLGYPFIRHLSNSAAIRRHPGLQYDMVRLGIGLYGIDSEMKLQNVTTLKTTVAQIKDVKKGESVGYNRAGKIDRDARIATVRIGYADGYPRILGNGKGKMMIHGKLVPVIGNVCMDMTMLDITGIEADESDEVTVFGEGLPVTDLAAWAETIPYEILTNISQRVKRVYYEE